MSDFELTPADKRSPMWLALADHLNERLAMHRMSNDASQPADRTEHLRGRIAEIKYLLGLGDEPRPLTE